MGSLLPERAPRPGPVGGESSAAVPLGQGFLCPVDLFLAHELAAHGGTADLHGLGVAADQVMLLGEADPEGDEPIGAAPKQPGEGSDVLGRQRHTVGDPHVTVGIVAAAMGAEVEQPAGHVGERRLAGVRVLDTDLVAEAATVAELLPLGRAQGRERLGAPEAGLEPGFQ